MIGITFGITRVLVALLIICFDNSSITANRRGIRELVSLVSLIGTKIFFGEPTQSLVNLSGISTITVSNKEVIFLASKFF